MTQEDKKLLLQDLCARLPYGVIVQGVFINYATDTDKILYEECDRQLNYQDLSRYESLKPYLRQMSSMTEEEKKEYELFANHCMCTSIGFIHFEVAPLIDWLNRKMFDYRGLIPKGLAIEVTENNNPYKN